MSRIPSTYRHLPIIFVAVLCAATAAARVAHAQAVAGSVDGLVLDQNGMPVKGVKVQALSPTQIGGPKTAYTNEEGAFRFPALTPGVFELVASAPRMSTIRQRGVAVDLGNPVSVTLVMEVKTEVDEVKIVEKGPVVNTTNAKLSRRIDTEFVNELPGNPSNEWWTLLTMTGGVEKGGTDDPYDRPAVRGAAGNKNAATIDGFSTNNPVTGAFGQLVDNQALAATEIASAGLGPVNGTTPGGAINMITKSGSNRFELATQLKYRDPSFTFFEDANDNVNGDRWFFGTVNVGGPIIRDRLWYQVSVRGETESRYPEADDRGLKPPNDTPQTVRILPTMTKLTWQVAPRHKLSYLNLSSVELWNNVGATNINTDPTAYNREYKYRTLNGISWEALLTDNLVLRTLVGYQLGRVETSPQLCGSDPVACARDVRHTNLNWNYSWGNFNEHSYDDTQNLQVRSTFDLFVDAGQILGSHNFTGGADFQLAQFRSYFSRPGGVAFTYRDADPVARMEYCSNVLFSPDEPCNMNNWQIQTNSGTKLSVFLQDSWRVTRYLTIIPGAAFNNALARDYRGQAVLNNSAVTPHLSAAWDPTHDGRTAIRGGYSQYADVAGLDVARQIGQGIITRTCDWDPATGDYTRNCRLSGGGTAAGTRTIGLPCGPGFEAEPGCQATKLGIPRTHEFTLGAEREVIAGLAVSLDFIYRRFDNQFQVYETNRIWNASGTDIDPNAAYKNGRAVEILDFGARPEAYRRYQAVETTASKREGKLRLLGSYTWSRLYGTQNPGNGGITSGDLGANPGQDLYRSGDDYLARDRRHQLKALGTYQFTSWFSAGVVYEYLTGQPYNRLFFNTFRNGYRDFRSSPGVDPGNNLNDPVDDRRVRLPDITRIDVKLRARLLPLLGHNVSIFMDVSNVLANRAQIEVDPQNDGPTWGRVGDRMDPTWAFLGLEYQN